MLQRTIDPHSWPIAQMHAVRVQTMAVDPRAGLDFCSKLEILEQCDEPCNTE